MYELSESHLLSVTSRKNRANTWKTNNIKYFTLLDKKMLSYKWEDNKLSWIKTKLVLTIYDHQNFKQNLITAYVYNQ